MKGDWTQGIFCANYYWSINGFTPCHRMWCGACYTSKEGIDFHVAKLEEVNEISDPVEVVIVSLSKY